MDVEKWKVFIKVAEVMNITTAAEQLNISQSGVSYIIKSLEEETGFQLLSRHKQGVALTSAGEELLPSIYEFLNMNEKLDQTISNISGLTRGTLRIGTLQSMAVTWLPEILYRYKKEFPQIHIELIEGGTDEIETALIDRKIDFAFTNWQNRPDCDWIELEDDYLKAILPKNHELASAKHVPLTFFIGEPFIGSANAYDYDKNHLLKSHNINPKNIVCSSRDDFSIMAIVRKGLGSSLVFSRVISAGNPDDLIVKDTYPAVCRKLGIAMPSKKHASPAAKMFVEYTLDILKNEIE